MAEGFKPQHTDFERSPYTGLDRESWLEAARYLMEGFFRNIHSLEDPPVCPRTEKEVTYPHLHAPEAQQRREEKAEVFEGLTRSLFIAAGLILNDVQEKIGGSGAAEDGEVRLRDYYAHWILKVTDPSDPWYVGSYEGMQAMCDTEDPFRIFQQTVETCALVIGLDVCSQQIWNRYTKAEQDQVAAFLSDWAASSTVPQNWRLFNMLDMAFLSKHGYPIREEIMQEHAAAVLNYYVGDGWYRDGQSFDFYSCWAFNFYAPLWCRWYGYEHAPEIAAQFEQNSNALMRSYPDFFDRDGWTLLWGRSSIYRNAATSAFDGNFFLKNSAADPGVARRIASGSLLQFLERDDLLADGVPSIGFYGPFTALVQSYSCAESVYWLGKAFLCLALPEDHPFWTAKESEGSWAELGPEEVKETVLPGPGLCFTDHGGSGETLLRTGKVVKAAADRHGMWEYGKLCYSTKFPWEADVQRRDGSVVASQEYVLTFPDSSQEFGNVTFWAGARDGIVYRRKFYDWQVQREAHWTDGIELADFAVPLGILRCDRLRVQKKPVQVTLGGFGFPDNGTVIEHRSEQNAEALILKGRDHMGRPRQLAMTIWKDHGWQALRYVHSEGINPDSARSILVYAVLELQRHYDAAEPHVLLSQVITREDEAPFSEEDLFPIASVATEDQYHTGTFGPVRIRMKNGTEKVVDFGGIEARLEV